jgi:drug/metabolite transporter (DMT)-like permease
MLEFMWIFFALGAVMVMSGSNILDSFLSTKRFSSGLSLALYSALFNIAFIPVVIAIGGVEVPPLSLIPIFLLASLLDILFLIPYYAAMRDTDASVVAALFALSRVFTPAFAYFILHEQLTPVHYLGFALIVASGVALSFRRGIKLHLNRALWLMALSSLLISFNSILYKHILSTVSWGTGMVWGSLFTVPWLIILCLLPPIRRQMEISWPVFRNAWKVILLNELVTFTAVSFSMYALFLAPVTLSSSMWGVQPFVIMAYAFILKKIGWHGTLEDVARGSLLKKIILFAVMLAGVFLIKE